MLMRDNLGYVHEIAEPQLYEPSSVVFDGLGNPIGQLGDFWDVIKSVAAPITAPLQAIGQAAGHILPAIGQALPAVGNLLTAPLQMAGGLVSHLLPGQQAAPAQAPVAAPAAPMPLQPPLFGGVLPPNQPFPWLRPPMTMFPPQLSFPPHPHIPPGWMHAPLPYTGLGPKRMYMRCAVWPGPAGLVPAHAAQMQPGQIPGMPGGPGAGYPGGYGHRRHHGGFHRRRR